MQCDRCGERFIEIDRYGERLIGCIECNRWSSDKSAFLVELSVEDFNALKNLELNGLQARQSVSVQKEAPANGGKARGFSVPNGGNLVMERENPSHRER
jgi:hypothetical protein